MSADVVEKDTQGRLTARRNDTILSASATTDTILQRPRTAGGQAHPAGRGRWTYILGIDVGHVLNRQKRSNRLE